MSAIEPQVPALATGQLLDAIGPDRFMLTLGVYRRAQADLGTGQAHLDDLLELDRRSRLLAQQAIVGLV